MNELHLFAGAGGGILGGMLLGHTCVCAVELEAYCRKVLLQRQRDGVLPKFPIWDDIRTFDGRPWRPFVDVVCGGFPCKGISVAGSGAGLDHEESGLWREQARVIGEIRPRYVFVENSPMLAVRGGVRVVADLAALGYDCCWGVISAADVIWTFGPPCLDHERARIWIYGALANGSGEPERKSPDKIDAFTVRTKARPFFMRGRQSNADANGAGCEKQLRSQSSGPGRAQCDSWWAAEPGVGRMAHGVANRVDRLTALGNGQVPAVVERAWQTLNL